VLVIYTPVTHVISQEESGDAPKAAANAGYLGQKLLYDGDRLVDADGESSE
jgi:hypothetical protein